MTVLEPVWLLVAVGVGAAVPVVLHVLDRVTDQRRHEPRDRRAQADSDEVVS